MAGEGDHAKNGVQERTTCSWESKMIMQNGMLVRNHSANGSPARRADSPIRY
jgi:hypothetical protein